MVALVEALVVVVVVLLLLLLLLLPVVLSTKNPTNKNRNPEVIF